jgi:hypothetical protein
MDVRHERRSTGRQLRAVVIITAAVAMAVAGGVAFASSSPVDPNGTVHGCYSPSSGAFKLQTSAACPSKGLTTPITFNTSQVEAVTWSTTLGDGTPFPVVQSSTVIESGSDVKSISGALTGDLSSCTGAGSVVIHVPGTQLGTLQDRLAAWSYPPGNYVNAPLTGYVGTSLAALADGPLVANGRCQAADGRDLPFPSVTFSVTIRWIHAGPSRSIP